MFEFLRAVCRKMRRALLDARYERGYRRVSDTGDASWAQAAMAGEVLPPKIWHDGQSQPSSGDPW